ncbi:MAG: (d)CMP kinase [Chloroflexota bacterium]|nr:(d)CMP kinase [Chloroflexota bacterium]
MTAEATVVTLDGPSGAGKTTVGRAVAARIGAVFVDTGLMYRALTVAAAERGIDTGDASRLGELARSVTIDVRAAETPGGSERVLLDGRDVSDALRNPAVDRAVSAVSRHAAVRDAMVAVQRRAAVSGRVVMAGRDIGTVVVPDATLKVFLHAAPEVRAGRRAAEMAEPDRHDEYLREISERDASDSGRAVAPLRVPDGALVLDTGRLDVKACVETIVTALSERTSARERAQLPRRR